MTSFYKWTADNTELESQLLLSALNGDPEDRRFEEEQEIRDYEYYRSLPPITEKQIEFEQELEGDNDEPYNRWIDDEITERVESYENFMAEKVIYGNIIMSRGEALYSAECDATYELCSVGTEEDLEEKCRFWDEQFDALYTYHSKLK